MAFFASPFFQNILDLNRHCPPKPVLTTYQAYYCDPAIRVEPNCCPGQNDIDIIDVRGIKTLKKGITHSGMCCQKRITTYNSDYTAPDENYVKLLNG